MLYISKKKFFIIMLFNINEYLINGYNTNLIYLLFIISIFCAISVIVTKNPIMSVLFLIGLFMSIAGYLMSIGIIFIGLSYLLIYVGAVSILFIFILMLINIRVSELISETNNSIPLAIIIGGILSNILYNLLPINANLHSKNLLTFFNNMLDTYFNNNNETLISSNNYWDSNLAEFNNIASLGNIIYTDFSIWLILTSLILLLAMVGAIVITIKQND